MKVSVAICTWNRADLLDKTLDRMRELRIPESVDWELLLVNNNCTDHTDDIISKHQDQLPLRRLLERKQGHSHARNCAVEAAEGSLLLWTDDDVLVAQDWLAEMVATAERHPECEFFGGPIRPWPESPMPAWLEEVWSTVEHAYAIRDVPGEGGRIAEDHVPFGANFAVRTETLRRYPFDPATGRVGAGMLGADETTVLRAMLRDGHRGWWAPGASVRHFIPADRMTLRYLRRYFEGQGEVFADSCGGDASARLFGIPRWLIRRAVAMRVINEFELRVSEPNRWITSLIESAKYRGMIRGLSRQSGRSLTSQADG